MRILLLEDDTMIAEAMRDTLKAAGYTVDWVSNGDEAETALRSHDYPLALLDIGVPKKDGLAVLKTLRSRAADTAVIMVTARDALEERVQGLDFGADDYVVKPFELGEVFARMRVLIRRAQGKADNQLSVANLMLDTAHKRVVMDDAAIDLTAKEYMLLTTFMLAPEKVMSKTELEDSLYGWGGEVESNAIEFLIHSLRKKLGQDRIKNVRGLGWYISNKG